MLPALIQRRPGLALLLLLAVSLVIPHWLSAQSLAESVDMKLPTLDDQSRLSDYLEFAAWNHPGLEAAFQRFQASFGTIEQVQTLPDPKLSYTYFLEAVETRVGPQRQKIGVSQTLPWLSKLRLSGDVASSQGADDTQKFPLEQVPGRVRPVVSTYCCGSPRSRNSASRRRHQCLSSNQCSGPDARGAALPAPLNSTLEETAIAIAEMSRSTTADAIPDSPTMMKALVYHDPGKRVWELVVSIANPRAMLALVDNSAVAPVAEEADERLCRVIDALPSKETL